MLKNLKSFLRTDIANILVALVTASGLFFYVSQSMAPTNGGLSNPFGSIFNPSANSNEENIVIPVSVIYDENKYFVTGAPREITITVTAAPAVINTIKSSNSATAVLDLRNLSNGKHQVDFEIRGVASNLIKSINPSNTTIDIAESDRKTLSIDADYQRNNLAEGVTEKSFGISANEATVIGDKSQIATVARIVAFLEIPENTDSDVSKSVNLQAQDANGNIVQGVQVSPSNVTASLTVNNPNNPNNSNDESENATTALTVPVTINAINGDVSMFSIIPSLQSANITGKEEDVRVVDSIVVTVDLSTITSETNGVYPLEASNVTVDPKNVQVTITPLN